MSHPASNRSSVFGSRSRHECTEMRLVLESVGISAVLAQHDGEWQVQVGQPHHDRAIAELEAYRLERSSDSFVAQPRQRVLPGAGWGVLVYVLTMISIYLLATVSAYGWPWEAVGRLRAGDVMSGQIWQTVTALTLHADTGHLASNLMFGSLFGFLAGRILGGGVAWLTIVLSGALGNLINALMRHADHTSIGASTAVFAGLGLLVAHAIVPRPGSRQSTRERYMPLMAGVLMLAYLGTEGERTDVLAHVAGFFSGLMVGWLACRIPERWLIKNSFQWCTGIATFFILSGAWTIAILMGRG
ncbi:rhomboid family intramembrane serine protease [Neorhodopirellula lusitana]|uniref:rhomboid family intramembrane serine protease n=1 Tax=Neorhodopirellula lusitana TaxID=445327 RepID=UPI00384C4A1D